MAVEARNLSPFPPQLVTSRDLLNINKGNTGFYSTQMGAGVPFAGTFRETLFPFPTSQVLDPVPAKTSMKADSGVSYNVPVPPRKRSRDSLNHQFQINNLSESSSFFGEEIPLQIHQQQSEIDRIVTEYKIILELEERQNQHAKLLLSAIGEGIAKKMKEKDEQIQRMGKMNWVLEERVKSLFAENQFWRDLAQTKEATANSLRNNLNQVLAHVSDERPTAAARGGGEAVEDDAESCCDSCDYGRDRKEEEEVVVAGGGAAGGARRGNWLMCKKCGEREARVLLLPCRHLCLCTVCGSTYPHICPVCSVRMDASLHVNMS